jgi:hypothetical protein
VDYTVFDLSTQDYLIRSADGLFVPLTAVAVVGLVVLWGYRLLPVRDRSDWGTAAAPVVIFVLALLGLALLSVAVIGVVRPELLQSYTVLPGLALTLGVALLMAASRMHRWLRQRHAMLVSEPLAMHAAEWTAVFLLASIGLFWAAGNWSAAVGTRRGHQVLASLKDWPDAVLYSDRRLLPPTPGVRETLCVDGDGQAAYRYDGLHLIVQAGGRYLFLPTDWQTDSRAIVVPKTDDVTLVFTAHGASGADTC